MEMFGVLMFIHKVGRSKIHDFLEFIIVDVALILAVLFGTCIGELK